MIPAILLAVLVVVGGGTAVAANDAKPGDSLFSIDQGIEKLRLSFSFSEDAKAEMRMEIAQEREQERLRLLQLADDDNAARAEIMANNALKQALESLNRVQQKIEDNVDSGKSEEVLKRVEEKLRHMRQVREESEKLRGNTHSDDDEEDDANENENENENTNDDDANENENENENVNSDDSDDSATVNESDDDAHENTNDDDANENENENENENSNREDDEDNDKHEAISMPDISEITVEVRDGKAEIHTRVNGVEHEWALSTNDDSAILLSIAAQTGLSIGQIQTNWDYDIEDES